MNHIIVGCQFRKSFNHLEVFGINESGRAFRICSYYEDEFHYTADDFVGLTIDQAREKHWKNVLAMLKN